MLSIEANNATKQTKPNTHENTSYILNKHSKRAPYRFLIRADLFRRRLIHTHTHIIIMTTYKIIRFHFDCTNTVIKKGLTLEQAQAHCKNPATSNELWFDGYESE